jgi:hypothetical protein
VLNPGVGGPGYSAEQVGTRSLMGRLRPGAVLPFHVVSDSSGDGLFLEGHGLRVKPLPSALGGVSSGDVVRLRVRSIAPRVTLELVHTGTFADAASQGPRADGFLPGWTTRSGTGDSALAQLLQRLDVARLPFASHLISVVLNSQRLLSPQLIRVISRRMERWMSTDPHGGRRAFVVRRRARALLETVDRGMDEGLDDSGFEELLALLSGLSDTGGSFREESRRDTVSQGRGDEEYRAEDLASYLTRSTDDPGDPLQLFNYLATTGELHWIVVPLAAGWSGFRTSGTLRIGIDRVSGRPECATLGLGQTSGSWWFSWEITDGRPLLRTAQPVDGAPEIPGTLLARLGGTRHTVTQGHPSGDGFTAVARDVPGLGGYEHG